MNEFAERIGSAAASTSYQARCRWVRLLLPQYVGNDAKIPDGITRHLSSCLVCRAEADRLRRVADLMGAEGSKSSITPPASLVDAVMDRLDEAHASRSWGKTIAAGVVLIVATAAVLVLGSRRRAALQSAPMRR